MATLEEIMRRDGATSAPELPSSTKESTGNALMDGVLGGGTNLSPVRSSENQIARKAKGFAGGLANTIADSAVGLFRINQSVHSSRADNARESLRRLKAKGETSGPLYEAYKAEYNMSRTIASKAESRAGTIDSFWDEKLAPLQLHDQTFWDQVAVGAGQLPAAATAAVPGVGLPILYGRMLNEGYETMKTEGFSDSEAMAAAEKYAIPATTLEFLVDRFMISKGGIQGLKGLKGTDVIKQGAKNVASLGKKMGLSGGSEGLTEVAQQAIMNKISGKPLLDGDMMNTFLVSSTLGVMGGGGYTLASAKSQADISNKMRRAGMSDLAIQDVVNNLEEGDIDAAQVRLDQEGIALSPEVLMAQLEGDDLTYEVAEYKVGAGRLGDIALRVSTTELEEELKNMQEDTLASLAAEVGYEGSGLRDDMEAFILKNRKKLPAFQRKAQKELLNTIETREDLSKYDRQVFKWLATGDLSMNEIGMATAVFNEQARVAGYETVEDYFEAFQGEFSGDKLRNQIELYQQQQALRTEDNPFAQRARKFAEAKLAARKLPIGAGRSFALSIIDRTMSPENMRRDVKTIVDRLDRMDNKDDVLEVLQGLDTSTPAQEQFLDYAMGILNGNEQDVTREEEIRKLFQDESFDRWNELDSYNPFKQYTAAWKLYGSVLERKTMQRLTYRPGMEVGMSVWNSGGLTPSGEYVEEGGQIGGLGTSGRDIASAAEHEGVHGFFGDVWAYIDEAIDESTPGFETSEWEYKASDLARMLYSSLGDPKVEVIKTLQSSRSRASDELMAMYISNQYNSPIAAIQEKADAMVEKLYGDLMGQEFVDAMRMSREAFQARTVPDNPVGQELVEFYQAKGHHGGLGVDGKPFSNFDLKYSGSGEGNAAFGYGVYLTEKFGIAKDYARALTRRVGTVAVRNGSTTPEGKAAVSWLNAAYRKALRNNTSPNAKQLKLDATARALELVQRSERRLYELELLPAHEKADWVTQQEINDHTRSRDVNKVRYEALQNIKVEDITVSGVTTDSNEFVYKVTIFPGQEEHEYNLLSWYEPVSVETIKRLRAIPNLDPVMKDNLDIAETSLYIINQEPYTGRELYNDLVAVEGSKKGASELLLANGIDGIVYPSQSLSSAKVKPVEGNRNFVIFNEQNIKIEEARAYDAGLEFFQQGLPTATGSRAIRGRTVFRPDGKFIVDLFKGGDVVSLAHEFAHVFSPHMSEEMTDAIIDKVIRGEGGIVLNKDKNAIAATARYMKGVWATFTDDPYHERFLNPKGKDRQYLTAMQETLARQFETYLATRTAPNTELIPAFKIFAQRYRGYYGNIRSLPKGMQKVNHKIATLFDEMIAGEKALPRVEPHRITVDGDTMTLHLTRPKEAIRRKTLQALEKVDADVIGLQEAVMDYANEMLGAKQVPATIPFETKDIKNNKDALRVMKMVESILAKQQLAIRKSFIKSIREMASKAGLKDVDPAIRKLIENTLTNVDLKPKSEKRVRKAANLARIVRDRLINAEQLGHEDLATTRAELKELIAIKNPSIYTMNIEQLTALQNAIADLIKYDDVRAMQHAQAMEQKLSSRTDEFSEDTRKTWQWRSRGKNQTVIGSKLGSVYRRIFAGTLENPSRTVEDLHAAGKRLYQELSNGRVKQDATNQHFTDRLADILAGIDLEGVSSSLGPAKKIAYKMTQITNTKSKEWNPETQRYVTINKRGGKPAELEMTMGQLLYIYGMVQNEDGYRHIMKGGIMRPKGTGKKLGDETAKFKFRSDEEMQTILQTIPEELRTMVDEIMTMYAEEVAPLINETSRELLGVDIANVINYLPMAIEGRSRGDKRVLHLSQLGNKGKKFALQQIEHASFLQSRTGGENSLYAMDLFDMIDKNLTDVAEYVGMAEPMRTATAILQPGDMGTTYDELATILGKKRTDRLWKWIQNIEDPSIDQSDTDRFLGKASSVVRRGILKVNLSVSLSQVVSLNNIKNYLQEGGVRRDLIASIMGSDGMPLKAKYSRREMANMHPTLRRRFESVPEVGLQSQNANARTQRRFGRHGGLGRTIAGNALLLGETGIGPVKKMDAWAVSKLIETVEKQAVRHKWSEEKKWDEIIQILNRTQPTSDPLHTSYFIGTPSNGMKKFVFGVFQSARDNIRGEIQTNWSAFRKAKHEGDAKGMRVAASNIFRSWVTGAAAVAVIQESVQRLLDNDDEDDEDNPYLLDVALRTLMNMIGIVPIGGAIISGAIDNALGNYTGDINSPLLQQLSKMQKLANPPEDDEAMDDYMLRLIKETAGMFGSGWKNIIRQSEAFFKED